MKRIKTVIRPICNAEQFDNEVSELIAAGWVLNKRDVINAAGEMTDAYNIPVVKALYAELEYWEPIFEEITL